MTFGIFLGVFLVIIACGGYAVIRSDRKRKLLAPSSSNLQKNSDKSARSIALSVSPDRARNIATRAMHEAGASKIEVLDDWVVQGWVGSVWTNIPSRTAYQMLIVISDLPETGRLQFTCQARPRFALNLGQGRSQELTDRLVSALGSLGLNPESQKA